jgi:ssDNA-binding Zn-finger/Zn-ribbon topoisomerase 1
MSFIAYDNCPDCDGEGFIKFISHQTEEHVEHETDQCAECEELHKQEFRADRMHDLAKGN